MPWYFLFFFVSGFCGILYEIVWLRLSMAQFGVTNALVSIVLSMFMAGLGAVTAMIVIALIRRVVRSRRSQPVSMTAAAGYATLYKEK